MSRTGWRVRWVSALAASVAFEILLVWRPWSGRPMAVVDQLVLGAGATVASLSSYARGRRESGRQRTGWLWLSVAFALFAASEVAFAVQSAVLDSVQPTGASPPDALAALSVPFAVVGLLRLSGTPSVTGRVVTFLDGAIVALACLFIGWVALLGPTYRSANGWLDTAVSLFYVGASVALAVIALLMAMRWAGDLLSIGLVASGFVVLSASTAAYALSSVRGTYVAGDKRIDLWLLVPFLLIALGAARPSAGERPHATLRNRWLLSLLVPYGAVLGVLLTGAVVLLQGHRFDAFEQATGALVEVLLLGRLLVTLLDNRTFALYLEQRVAERSEAVRQSEARMRTLLRHSSDVIALVDSEGALTYASPATATVLGYSPTAVVGQQITGFVHGGDRAAAERVLSSVARDRRTQVTLACRFRCADGSWRPMEATVSPLPGEGEKTGLVLNIRDVSERAALQRELHRQALHDPLTSLPNRTLLTERVQHALDRAGRTDETLAVLYVDLDHFKRVNDTAGHAAGDAVLVQVADRLRRCLRPSDTAARIGGDEFAVLLENTDRAEAEHIARRVVEALEPRYLVAQQAHTVTASVGVTVCARGDCTGDVLLRDADVAMYQAKAEGRGRFVVFHAQMRDRLVEQGALEEGLVQALEQGGLAVVYQPVVDLETNEVTGVEALARWPGGQGGAVPPALFIPLAEERGLIHQVDLWVLRECCRQVVDWQRRFPRHAGLRANVNLSAVELRNPHLAREVEAVLDETGLAPSGLTLEVTETAVLLDPGAAAEVLAGLRELGVSVSLDDFGTGFSSLVTLQSLPVDEIKVDGSFVRALAEEPAARQVVKAIVSLAAALGLRTVAEGVETREQLDWLQSLRCDAAQGFLLAPPMPPAELEVLFARGLPSYVEVN
jgi:diguanylate cyclase (GGDEF)-like protein/PAS domain S-box-containing protein